MTALTPVRPAPAVAPRPGGSRSPEGVASVTVLGPSLTWAAIEATAAYAQGAGALAWLGTPRACGLVVAEGRVAVFGEPGIG